MNKGRSKHCYALRSHMGSKLYFGMFEALDGLDCWLLSAAANALRQDEPH